MKRHISISPGKYFEEFIQARIDSGRFRNVDEVVRNALRLLEAEEQKVPAHKPADFIDERFFYSGKSTDDDLLKGLEL